MTKQSLQQQNCEVKICRFGKKKTHRKTNLQSLIVS